MSRLADLIAEVAPTEGDIRLYAGPNCWDTPAMALVVVQLLVPRFPDRKIVMVDRAGRPVAGYVPA